MKNKLNIILCLTVVLIFSSCKKNYDCTCDNGGIAVVSAKNTKEAEQECNDLSTCTTNTIPQTYDSYYMK